MGALLNRVVLVSRRPGFRFWVFLHFVWVGYVLGDDHSLMGGVMMRGLGGLLDCLDAQHHVVCPVCVPPGRGDCLCVFALCFPPSM